MDEGPEELLKGEEVLVLLSQGKHRSGHMLFRLDMFCYTGLDMIHSFSRQCHAGKQNIHSRIQRSDCMD